MNWQPIETAPRDGTQILAFWISGNIYGAVSWDNGLRSWIELHEDVYDPTHWMPLPPPPKD